MVSLKSAIFILRAKPYHPFAPQNDSFRQSPLILSLERGGTVWGTGRHTSVATTKEGRNVGSVDAHEWAEGWWEITRANVDSFRQGEGIAQALYCILAEAAPRGIIPNITDSVSDDAARVWKKLAPYGTMTKLQPDDRLVSGLVSPEEAEDSDLQKFTSWDDIVSRGLDVNFSNPLPPEGYSSWQELCLATGGLWSP